MVLDAQQMETCLRLLILSDKKAGHENQSIAFAKHLNAEFEILHVNFKNKLIYLIFYIFILKISLHVRNFLKLMIL